MAAYSWTDANVVPAAGSTIYSALVAAGVTITPGMPCILNSDGEIIKAGAATADLSGAGTSPKSILISLTSATAGQPVSYVQSGDVAYGAIFTVGAQVYLGATAGELVPFGDLTTGNFITYVGYATTTSNLRLNPVKQGIALP